MVSILLSFLVASAVHEYSGLNFTQILLNEFDKIKNRTDFDPAMIKSELKYRYDDQPKKLNVSIEVDRQMEILGFSNLELKEVDLELKPLTAQFDLNLKYELPKLRANGVYKLKGKAFNNIVPVKGHGPFYIQLQEIKGFANMTIGYNGTQFVVDDLKFDLHFNKLNHYFQNLMFKGLSRVTNTIMSSFSKQLIYRLLIKNENVMNDLKKKLSKIIDKRLFKINGLIMNYVGSYIGLKGTTDSN